MRCPTCDTEFPEEERKTKKEIIEFTCLPIEWRRREEGYLPKLELKMMGHTQEHGDNIEVSWVERYGRRVVFLDRFKKVKPIKVTIEVEVLA